jgi:Ca2+-binding RTX toxin-like protein
VEKVIGSAFGDAITGGVGGETLSGGAGDDLLNGGAGDDLLDGGEGLDTASYADATGGVTVDLRILLASGPAGTDALVSIENVVGSGFADILSGFQGANSLSGGDGADTLNGLGGDDILDGGAGDDRIFSGSGTDLLTGGGGVDTFLFTGLGFSTTAARDRITDLTGKDVIDLAGIDADSLTAGDQAFHQVAAFSGMAGELVLTYDASLVQTRLTADVNGDGLADFDLLVNGKHLNSAGWIL